MNEASRTAVQPTLTRGTSRATGERGLPRTLRTSMNSPTRAFFTGIIVFIGGSIILLVLSLAHLGDILGASPTHKPGNGTILKSAATIWFSGTYLTRTLLDGVIFGGPMPPEGSKIDPRTTAKAWQIYDHEKDRRCMAYGISWLVSPLLFGFVFAIYARLKINKKAPPDNPRNSQSGQSNKL